MSAYETGDRNQVFTHMVECALRDRQTMLDSISYGYGNCWAGNLIEVNEVKAEIRDFEKLAKTKP